MGRLGDLTLGELWRGLGRYRPVAITVVVIVIALQLLPNPKRPAAEADDIATGPTATTAPQDTAGAPADAAAPADSSASFTSGGAPFSSSTVSSGDPFSSGSGGDGSVAPGESSFFSSPPGNAGEQEAATVSGPAKAPLKVVGSTWATRTAGTPLAKEGVPAGTLPVGVRAGQDDKLSFVRLAGEDTVLKLAEDPSGFRDVNGPILVEACQATQGGWQNGEAIDLDGAPAYDAGTCVTGQKGADGLWVFDLAGFATRTDDRGFALRPRDGTGLDAQVAFKPA